MLFTVLFICQGCAGRFSEHQLRVYNADLAAGPLKRSIVQTKDFAITVYSKALDPTSDYVFYIEGDGLAFINKSTISEDPTPRTQVLLPLAAIDPRPNVVYISRPCQYTDVALNARCLDFTYWTDGRMSPVVVDSINEVINTIAKNSAFSLVGYSGGGGIAILIASINPRTKDIVTIAGNLDIAAFNHYHSVKPMLSSMNPIDYAIAIKHIPQLHLCGGEDKIVPPFLAQEYARKSASNVVRYSIIPKNTHQNGWKKVWVGYIRDLRQDYSYSKTQVQTQAKKRKMHKSKYR
ncbi:alpha/beta hydrolase family protein [Candidatus Sarmatiella mevalonica]|uniref:alpha/beta hydrolase family protein n=1 Tax=Candidatus Sarmatiella mevalonica TaxID=2770581 RepID=UPI001924459D|nr:alpha/beta hydrolase [Candidatus Sarmatiella mevalonica]